MDASVAGHTMIDHIALPDPPLGRIDASAVREDRYGIHVVSSFEELLARLEEEIDATRVGIVTDSVVDALYGRDVVRGLRASGVDVHAHVLPPGERSKSRVSAEKLWNWLAAIDSERRDVLLAFGGGVVCDLTGWVASAYMRGVTYVNVPTTLLAMVDGALGGKVAVNHPSAKNLLGAFHQPRAVVSHVAFLRTLERRQIASGLAEAIKKAVIASPAFLESIERDVDPILDRDHDALLRLVAHASHIKTILVGRDPYEVDLRRPLNFGHTIGHPLETVTGYGPLLHGEAVAFGMVVEGEIAASRGLLAREDLDRLVALLRYAGLPTRNAELPVQPRAGAVIAAMAKVRQIRAGSLRWVLPTAFGATVIVDDVTEDEVLAALHSTGMET
jgi:3-dehydroquinate synthase